ncbi:MULTISPECIES: helix-turn-helix domain-containing protein [Corallococcus]|uniref:helix-turn-helix domain-containing protein n=1 Tax=Corallococcus TaxID=83461 RepID=UPI001F2E7BF6|nr:MULTISPECIES: helix-turn-helix transcriptional regulator [Corallococcus]
MKLHSWKGMRREKFTPAQLKEQDERVQKELLEMSLREVREFAGMTQTQLAERMGISQGQLSQTEARDDHRLSTLRRAVEAMGGEIEVSAVFGDKRIILKGV